MSSALRRLQRLEEVVGGRRQWCPVCRNEPRVNVYWPQEDWDRQPPIDNSCPRCGSDGLLTIINVVYDDLPAPPGTPRKLDD